MKKRHNIPDMHIGVANSFIEKEEVAAKPRQETVRKGKAIGHQTVDERRGL